MDTHALFGHAESRIKAIPPTTGRPLLTQQSGLPAINCR
jgi:hypothetical protein